MKALPKSELHKVKIKENNEPLGKIEETESIKLLMEHRYLTPYLRLTVRDLLYKASENLLPGYKLLVVTAYRPLWMQEELWNQRVRQITKRHLLKRIFNPREFKRIVGLYTAPPGGSSHQCGAAVDVSILNEKGERLDMGSELTDYGEKCRTDYEELTEEQKENRKLLLETMSKVGFVNYPLEWWHYSYGDKLWAAYSDREAAFYGPITEDSSNISFESEDFQSLNDLY